MSGQEEEEQAKMDPGLQKTSTTTTPSAASSTDVDPTTTAPSAPAETTPSRKESLDTTTTTTVVVKPDEKAPEKGSDLSAKSENTNETVADSHQSLVPAEKKDNQDNNNPPEQHLSVGAAPPKSDEDAKEKDLATTQKSINLAASVSTLISQTIQPITPQVENPPPKEPAEKIAPTDAMDIDKEEIKNNEKQVVDVVSPEDKAITENKNDSTTGERSSATSIANQETKLDATTVAMEIPKPEIPNAESPTAMEMDSAPDPTTTRTATDTQPKPTPGPADQGESLQETFETFIPNANRRKKKKVKAMNISFLSTPVKSKKHEEPKVDDSSSMQQVVDKSQPRALTTAERMLASVDEDCWGVDLHKEVVEEENDDALAFFEETHEEQDPAFVEYMRRKEKDGLKAQLAEVEMRDQEGRKEIEVLISRLSKEKRESTDKSHQVYREKVDHEEHKEMALLQKTFQERSQAELQKIQKGQKYLQVKQQEEVNMALQHHNQMNFPEQVAQMEWQKTTLALQGKHQRQINEFTKRSEGLRRKTTVEFKREQEKIKKKYGKKKTEVDARRDKYVSQQMSQFAQLKQRYLKRHIQKIMAERESIMQEMSDKKPEGSIPKKKTPLQDVEAAAMDKEEHRPPSPVTSTPDWVKDLDYKPGSSITRQKHRKSILSQALRQLSIEIHNEGIWSLLVRKAEEDGKTETLVMEFIEWGQRAFTTLQSIVCGEIPYLYESIHFRDTPGSQGGQIRCSITDLRTSKETASVHRAEALKELEASKLRKLEKNTNDLLNTVSEAENGLKNAELEERQASVEVEKAAKIHDKAKSDLEAFTTKFRSFIGPDGNPLPTANAKHRQDLMQTIMQYKSNISLSGGKAAQAHQHLTEIKNRIQRLNLTHKAAQKSAMTSSAILAQKKASLGLKVSDKALRQLNASDPPPVESPENKVTDVLSSLAIVAEKRREQLNQKKNSTFTKTWAQSYPELSEAMKKSLWHRMVRRKQQVVLRPTHEALVNELLQKVKEAKLSAQSGGVALSTDALEEEILKAEQIYLLACHPAPDEQLPSVPTTPHGQWAEPGWTLDLSVPKHSTSSILPCAPSFPVLNKAMCDFVSAPGRQAASVLLPSSFRPFMAPLTTLSKASSLAEAETKLFPLTKASNADPFEISNEEMKKGYYFSVKPVPPKAPPPRRKSISKDDASESRTAGSTAKSCDNSLSSTSERSQKRRRSSKESEASPRKKKKKSDAAAAGKTTESGSLGPSATSAQQTSATSRSRKKQLTTTAPPKQIMAPIQPAKNAPKQVSGPQQTQSQHQYQNQPQQPKTSPTPAHPQHHTVETQKMSQPNQQQSQHQRRPSQQQQRQIQQQQLRQQQLRQQQKQSQQQQQQQQQQQSQQQNLQQRQQQNRQQQRQQQQQNMQQSRLQQNQQQRQQQPHQQQQPQQNQQQPQNQQATHTQQQNQTQQQLQQQHHQQQMAQFRMMHPGMGRQVPGFPPTMQQMQQFYAPLGHPGQGQRVPFQPGLSPIQMQRAGMSMPFPGMAMPGQSPQQQSPNAGNQNAGQHGQQQQQQQQQQRAQGQQRDPKDQNDPLFMLK